MIHQVLAIMKKEVQLLSRSKSSTLALLLGPLLIILLVGLVFSNVSDSELVLGVITGDFEEAQEYADVLSEAFIVVDYERPEQCAQAVREGVLSGCVSLEPGEPPTARIFVDPSDVNIVYQVIDRVTGQIENRSTEVRTGLSGELLGTVARTAEQLNENQKRLGDTKLLLEEQIEQTGSIAGELPDVQVDVELVTRQEVGLVIDDTIDARDEYRGVAEELLKEYRSLINRVSSTEDPYTSDTEKADDLGVRIDALNENVDASGNERVFADLLTSLDTLKAEIDTSKQTAQSLTSQASQVRIGLTEADNNLQEVIDSVTLTQLALTGLDITQTDITSPINPVVEPIVSNDDALGFIFPYFLTLLVMFTAMLLSSSMIVRERESAAYFRNFTTPTPEWVFVIATYLTTLAVLITQLLIITLAATFLIQIQLLGNIGTMFLLLLVITTFFTLLGMVLGYSFKSREGVMLSVITTASILLFLSGLIFPLQSVPGLGPLLIQVNPFVIGSEMIKATLLFDFSLAQLFTVMLILVLYSIVMFALIMIVQRIARIRAFERTEASRRISEFLVSEEIPENKKLVLGKHQIMSKKALLDSLKKMSDDEYEKHCTHKHNKVADWIRDVYKDDVLARKLQNKSREGAIMILEKDKA